MMPQSAKLTTARTCRRAFPLGWRTIRSGDCAARPPRSVAVRPHSACSGGAVPDRPGEAPSLRCPARTTPRRRCRDTRSVRGGRTSWLSGRRRPASRRRRTRRSRRPVRGASGRGIEVKSARPGLLRDAGAGLRAARAPPALVRNVPSQQGLHDARQRGQQFGQLVHRITREGRTHHSGHWAERRTRCRPRRNRSRTAASTVSDARCALGQELACVASPFGRSS